MFDFPSISGYSIAKQNGLKIGKSHKIRETNLGKFVPNLRIELGEMDREN